MAAPESCRSVTPIVEMGVTLATGAHADFYHHVMDDTLCNKIGFNTV